MMLAKVYLIIASSLMTLIKFQQVFQLLPVSHIGLGLGQASAISMYTYSEDEDTALSEFREQVEPLAYRTFMKSDGYLIRWLMQTDFDVDTALDNFKNFLEWRRRKNIDHVVFEDFPATFDNDQPFLKIVGNDMIGRPVFWTPMGRSDMRKITIAGQQDLYLRYVIRTFEMSEVYLQHLSSNTERTTNPNIFQAIAIYDLDGFNLKNVGCMKCLNMIPESLVNLEPNYPILFNASILINTPKIFMNTLSVITSLISEKSRQSLRVFGHDKDEWMTALRNEIQIPADQLPIDYGGTQPSFRKKAGKDAQIHLFESLLIKAKEAVWKDLPNLSENWTVSTAVITTLAPAPTLYSIANLDEQEEEQVSLSLSPSSQPPQHCQHHHHHYHDRTSSPAPFLPPPPPDVLHHHNETEPPTVHCDCGCGGDANKLSLNQVCVYAYCSILIMFALS